MNDSTIFANTLAANTPDPENEWFVELRPLADAYDVHGNIVRHLPERLAVGNAVVLCNNPAALVAAFYKRWQRLIKEAERMLAYTRDAAYRKELLHRLDTLRRTRFITSLPPDAARHKVLLARPSELAALPPSCYTLYIAARLGAAEIAPLLVALPKHGTAVIYG